MSHQNHLLSAPLLLLLLAFGPDSIQQMGSIIAISPHDQNTIKKNRITAAAVVRLPFQVTTTALLNLLIPLSFLLLARLSTAQYLLSVADNYPTRQPTNFLCSLFLHTKKPTILHFLVSIVSVSSLAHGLSGKITFLGHSAEPLTRARLLGAWIMLCGLQICVYSGIEGSIGAGIDGSDFGRERSLLSRMMFFFGLHETMLFWWRTVVKPVVDDTVFGFPREEGWVEKAATGMIYGGLWWWRLKEEVEALVVVPEVKRELMMGIGVADFLGWWLYYLTVTIGIVKGVKGFIYTVTILTRRRVEEEEIRPNDEKV